MAELFGFRITKANQGGGSDGFTTPSTDDGTLDVVSGGGHYASVLDMDGRDKNEVDLIRRYRDIAQQPECDSAIEDIANEAIVSDERGQSVSISLDRLELSPKIKSKIRDEFDEVLRLLDFDSKGHDIFRRWYVDGRIYYHKIIEKNAPRKGIKEVRYIDPRKIKKVRETRKETDQKFGMEMVKGVEDYYLYNDKGWEQNTGTSSGIRITADSITYCPSGLVDMQKGSVLSYLHKAIKPVNQLRMIEDALVIYRISRAPERRIFYIDVGNLPKVKAEAYLKDVMNRYRNKLVYDARTGEIRDDRNHMSMLEDFWLPRREGGRGTEITTLPGGSNLGEIDDIKYFQTKLYRSLNVPISRLEAENSFSIGRSDNITRDELKFTKFVQKIRKKFSLLFLDMLRTQLILKGVIAEDEWPMIKELLQFDFMQDGHFTELKNAELLQNRIDMLGQIESYVGTYFSKEYVKKQVLRLSDEEIEEMDSQIKDESGSEMGAPEDDGMFATNNPELGDK
jgi:hypothetical protein